jgi:hypothetical protein
MSTSNNLGTINENINYFIKLKPEQHTINFSFIKEQDFLTLLGYKEYLKVPSTILKYLHPPINEGSKKTEKFKTNPGKRITQKRFNKPKGGNVPVLRFTALLRRERHFMRLDLHGICLNYREDCLDRYKLILKTVGNFLFNLIQDKII